MLIRPLALAAVAIATSVSHAEQLESGRFDLSIPERTQLTDPATVVRDFSLTDQNGATFRAADLQGKTSLVFFGFTNCPNVCPPTLQRIRQVQKELGVDHQRVIAVFVSVDGERDTPEALRRFLAGFGPGFIGLTGDPKLVGQLAEDFSAVFFKGMPTDAAGGYNMEHTSQTYLVDKDGRLRATFFNAPVNDMIQVTRSVL